MSTLIPVFMIRIVYKSGYTHDFEATSFEYSSNKAEWTAYDTTNKPLHLGIDNIEAIYQIGVRKVEKE